MPVGPCSSGNNPGFRWGDSGKCYTYTAGDKASMDQARKKAEAQGLAARLNGYSEKTNEVTTQSMGSGIKNPQQGYGSRKKKKIKYKQSYEMVDEVMKSLTEWFREEWVDLSRPKPGGGFEPCGRADASTGKYPKCVPASRAARMTPEQIASAIRRKRRAESTETRQDKKPIYVSTVKKASRNVPTNPELYARVKAEAKAKFDVYPSAYANAWLVREYKKRGGGYRTVNKFDEIQKIAEDVAFQEAMVADALQGIAQMFGPFDAEGTGIWVDYETPEKNEEKEIGVKCANCILYAGNGKCKILSQMVEEEGKCRFALIPDGVVDSSEDEDETEDSDGMESEYEQEDENSGLNERQQMQYELLEQVAEKYGKWDQSAGAEGSHYASAAENPFKQKGLICANCVYYQGGQGCEIVSGKIEPEAICKLWIINESLIKE
jgi:hypothetical protein